MALQVEFGIRDMRLSLQLCDARARVCSLDPWGSLGGGGGAGMSSRHGPSLPQELHFHPVFYVRFLLQGENLRLNKFENTLI